MPENEKGNLLVFQEKKHSLTKFLAVAGDAPLIEVKHEEVSLEPKNAVVNFPGMDPVAVPKVVTVFKFEGKMIILTGHAEALSKIGKKENFKAKLISTPALKKSRIQEPDPLANQGSIQASNDFVNRPRWKSDTGAPRSPYRGTRKY